jgi:hypothetical protein
LREAIRVPKQQSFVKPFHKPNKQVSVDLARHVFPFQSVLLNIPSCFQIDVGANALIQHTQPFSEIQQRIHCLAIFEAIDMRKEHLRPGPYRFDQMASEGFKSVINVKKYSPHLFHFLLRFRLRTFFVFLERLLGQILLKNFQSHIPVELSFVGQTLLDDCPVEGFTLSGIIDLRVYLEKHNQPLFQKKVVGVY